MSYIFDPAPVPTLAVADSQDRIPVRRIFCIGRNYAAHAVEMGKDPDRDPPFFFLKPNDAVVEDGATVLVGGFGMAGMPVELIDAPKAAPLLSGYQNAVPVNKKALVDLVQRVSAMADDIPEIRELACEPVLASASAAEITDARVRLGPEPTRNDLGPRRLR